MLLILWDGWGVFTGLVGVEKFLAMVVVGLFEK